MFLKTSSKNPTMQKQKYYFQDNCLHICAPQERAGNYIFMCTGTESFELLQEMLPGHQLVPTSPAPRRVVGNRFQAMSLRDSHFTALAGEQTAASPDGDGTELTDLNSAHGTTSHKFSLKQLTVTQSTEACQQIAVRQDTFPKAKRQHTKTKTRESLN